MNRMLLILCLCLTLPCLALAAASDTPPAQPAERGEVDATATPDVEVNRAEQEALAKGEAAEGEGVLYQRDELADKAGQAQLSPMMTEIQAVLEFQRTQRAELEDSYQRAVDDGTALAVQNQIEQLARQTELNIMNIQIRHLRAAGHEEDAQAIEAELELMASPRPTREPVDRSAGESPRTRR